MEQAFTTLVLWNNAPVESKKKKTWKQNSNNWQGTYDHISVIDCK